jgi:hypothetical protein
MSHLVCADAAMAVKPSAATSVRRQVFISKVLREDSVWKERSEHNVNITFTKRQ